MSALENSVQTLADALDRLETTLEDRIADAAAHEDAADDARRQAYAARNHISDAGKGLAASIGELRAMLDAPLANNSQHDEA